jgi:putative exporter of polyketide antibiotics
MITIFLLSFLTTIASIILVLKLKQDVRTNNSTGFIDLSLTNSRPLRNCCDWHCLYRMENDK